VGLLEDDLTPECDQACLSKEINLHEDRRFDHQLGGGEGEHEDGQQERTQLTQSSERKVIEKVSEIFPDIGVAILAKTFIVKTIHLSDLSRLVVSS
jgi:hypothetical protein